MRKNCSTCFYAEFGQCHFDDCKLGKNGIPTKWVPAPFWKPDTNADRIRAMSDEELADFFFESHEIEFTVCEYCEYFGGHTSDTPCKHDMGCCLISAKNEAFKKWLKQPAEQKVIKNYKKVVDK